MTMTAMNLAHLGFLELFFVVPVMLLALFATCFWVWMLVDCALHETSTDDKVVWILIILFTHFLGALLYFIFRRPRRGGGGGSKQW